MSQDNDHNTEEPLEDLQSGSQGTREDSRQAQCQPNAFLAMPPPQRPRRGEGGVPQDPKGHLPDRSRKAPTA